MKKLLVVLMLLAVTMLASASDKEEESTFKDARASLGVYHTREGFDGAYALCLLKTDIVFGAKWGHSEDFVAWETPGDPETTVSVLIGHKVYKNICPYFEVGSSVWYGDKLLFGGGVCVMSEDLSAILSYNNLEGIVVGLGICF